MLGISNILHHCYSNIMPQYEKYSYSEHSSNSCPGNITKKKSYRVSENE